MVSLLGQVLAGSFLPGGDTNLSGYATARFTIKGKFLYFEFSATGRTCSGSAGQINISLPVVGVSAAQNVVQLVYDGSNYVTPIVVIHAAATSKIIVYKTLAADNWVADETGVLIDIKSSYFI